jgi:multisite-specific tRNA:(cytosine-C5)-methyltransferase
MTTPKNVVRKYPPFAAFQKFLVSETSVGNISRQEVVSMIPPLLLDVRPGMTVLDMCAAPGSKATQLLEMIHVGEEERLKKVLGTFSEENGQTSSESSDANDAELAVDSSDAGRATGLLIANDSDYKRSHLLVHQLKRISSANLLVTNHDATQYPSIRLPSPTNRPRYLKFDRILADVPCSGDGTLRKNVNLWKDWVPGSALGLHLTQIRILTRALQLLKVGGRVVYSTCSMNPVENESIIAEAIDRCGGIEKVDIIDCSDQFPDLKRSPGLKSWNIMDKSGRIWNSMKEIEEYVENSVDKIAPGRVTASMFPSTESTKLPLERCMRVYAHQQDTGGFFITVLEKKAEVKVRPENEPKEPQKGKQTENGTAPTTDKSSNGTPAVEEKLVENDTTNDATPDIVDVPAQAVSLEVETTSGNDATKPTPTEDAIPNPTSNGTKRSLEESDKVEQGAKRPRTEGNLAQQLPRQQRNARGVVEEPFKYLKPDHAIIQNIKTFYGLSTKFPEDRFMVRNALGEPVKAIYYTTSLSRDILTANEGRSVKFIHAGVKMFMKQEAPSAEVCAWRIQSEGMNILHAYVGEHRVVRLYKKDTLKKLLIEMFPKISDGDWSNFDEIGEVLRDVGMGCLVLRIVPDGEDPSFSESMTLPLWKSIHSLNLMLPKEDRSAMLLRIFNDTTPLVNNSLRRQEEIKAAKAQKKQTQEEYDGEDGDAEAGTGAGDENMDEVDEVDIEDMPTPEAMDAEKAPEAPEAPEAQNGADEANAETS